MNLEKIKQVLKDIGIEKKEGVIKKKEGKPDIFVIELDDSDEYAKYYTLFDKYEKSQLKNEGSMASEFSTILTYVIPNYKIMLNANFNDDYYAIILKENKEK